MGDYNIIKSQRGRDKIVSNGFIYTFKKETTCGTDYRCSKRTCPGNIRIMNSKLYSIRNHNHNPCFEEAGVAIIQDGVKARAIGTTEKPMDIITRFVQGDTTYLATKLPKIKSMVDRVTRTS